MTKFPVVDRIVTGVAAAILGAQCVLWAEPASTPDPSQALIDRYLAASASQREALKAVSMDVEIDAALPKLKKEGKMYALKYISRLGRIRSVAKTASDA